MGEKATLAKARMELEELYLGIPDESVNLTFQDLADIKKHHQPLSSSSPIKKPSTSTTPTSLDPISDVIANTATKSPPNPIRKLPSLDFSRGLQEQPSSYSNPLHHPLQHHNEGALGSPPRAGRGPPRSHVNDHVDWGDDGDAEYHRYRCGHAVAGSNRSDIMMRPSVGDSSIGGGYEDHDTTSVSMSMGRERRRRPGIPHSNICTICSTYVYIFRHRCLVCGRAYCRNCVSIGMGEMTEGRKCVQCLGRRFSHRYIQRAGNVGCCSRCPSMVKQAELKWAEKGPRRMADQRGGDRGGTRPGRRPVGVTPSIPTQSGPPSFVMSSSHSPYSPSRHHHHHLPF